MVLTLHLLLMACRYYVPLVADIHFQPVVANMVAECFEKIRVNPGNFVDGRKRFDEKVYDDDSQFKQEQEHIREVRTCVHVSDQCCSTRTHLHPIDVSLNATKQHAQSSTAVPRTSRRL